MRILIYTVMKRMVGFTRQSRLWRQPNEGNEAAAMCVSAFCRMNKVTEVMAC